MDIFDKSLTLAPFSNFLTKYSTQINMYVETSQPFAIIGAYGLGKGIICDYIRNLSGQKYKVAYINLELFTDLTPPKLFGSILHSLESKWVLHGSSPEVSEDDFYWRMTEILTRLKQQKLIILIRHCSKMLYLESKALIRFNNFVYDNYEKLIVIGSSSPKIINFPSDDLNSLFGNNFLYLSRLDYKTAVNDVRLQEKIYHAKFTTYEKKILKLSHNVHGTIVFLCSVLAKYKPKDLNEHFIYQTVYGNPKLKLFFHECFESLTSDQIDIIYNYCLLHRLSKADLEKQAFGKLVEFNIFYKSGKSYKFIYEIFNGFILRFLHTNVESKKISTKLSHLAFAVDSSKFLTKEELKVMQLLVMKGGGIVTYEEIALLIWGNGNKFSMYAINKLISRIRLAILKNSDWKCTIVTKYKAGYYLVC